MDPNERMPEGPKSSIFVGALVSVEVLPGSMAGRGFGLVTVVVSSLFFLDVSPRTERCKWRRSG